MNGFNEIKCLNKTNQSLCKHTDLCAHRCRAVPAVRSVTLSSRPDRGLWFETVQLAVSLSYLPDGLVWPGVTLARSACLFSTFSLTQLLHLPPRTEIRTHFPPRGNVNIYHITEGCTDCRDPGYLSKISMLQRRDIRTLLASTFPLMSVLYNM